MHSIIIYIIRTFLYTIRLHDSVHILLTIWVFVHAFQQ